MMDLISKILNYISWLMLQYAVIVMLINANAAFYLIEK